MDFFEQLTIKRHAILMTMSFLLYVLVANNIAVTSIPAIDIDLKSSIIARKLLALTVLVYTFTWLSSYIFDKKRIKGFQTYSSYRYYIRFYDLPVEENLWSEMLSREKFLYTMFRLKATWFYLFFLLNFLTGVLGFGLAVRVLFPWFPWFGEFMLDWLNFTGEIFEYFT